MSNNMEEDMPLLNSQNASQFKKFSRLQWNKIEKSYDDPITKAVLDAMQKLGLNNNAETTEIVTDIKICGDEIYENIRKSLFDKGLIDADTYIAKESDLKQVQKKSKNKNKKRPNQKLNKEEIIKNNTVLHVSKNMEEVIKTFSYTKYNVAYGFHSQYAEIRLITFLYAIKYWTDTKPINLPHCYELVLGIRKTLNNIHLLKNVSKIAINDLTRSYNNFVKYCNFTYANMFEKFPRLCLMTAYDIVFTNMSIKPYPSQKTLMSNIKLGLKNGGLYCYKAMIGTGKTTFAIGLCESVNVQRILEKAQGNKTKLQLLFACSVEPVRHQVCRMAYNQQIPFGIAVLENNGSTRIINNFSCKSDDNRILVVADLDTTIELLKKDQDYILFIDEPTVGADQENHPITKAVAKIMSLSPKITILCSATLPDAEEIDPIILDFKGRHPEANSVTSICSKESLIGCEIINFDGSTILPHNDCNNMEELIVIIENLKTKPFIDRLYTAPVIYRLSERMKEMGIKNVINLEKYFSDIDALSQTNIQKAAILLLEILLAEKNDSLIKKVCVPFGKIIIDENIDSTKEGEKEEGEEDESDGFMWQEEKKENVEESNVYNLDNIFTSEAYRYLGGCLVTVKNPYNFAYEKSKILRENCESATKIISKYTALIEKFNQSLIKLDYIKNEDERSKKQQELQNNFKPEFTFPSHLRVNTMAHVRKFCKSMFKSIDPKNLRYNFNLESLPLDLNIPDWVMLLLFAGIGVYDPNHNLLDQRYLDLVLDMTAEGKLSFLIADENICYGANYPFSHVIIDDEITKDHSIGTIFQLIGRAGRVGQSWVAYAHVGDLTSKRIMNYIRGVESSGISIEANNLNKCFNKVKEEIIKEEDRKSNIIKLSEVVPIKIEKQLIISVKETIYVPKPEPEPEPEPVIINFNDILGEAEDSWEFLIEDKII